MNAERGADAHARAVTTRCGTRQPRNVAPGMSARGEEERVHHDFASARSYAGLDAGVDGGIGEFHVSELHDVLGQTLGEPARDGGEHSIGRGRARAVVDEQDRPLRSAALQRQRASAASRSAHRSPASSSPTESRTTASLMPLRSFSSGANAAWLISHG